jgi:hypothetical protein
MDTHTYLQASCVDNNLFEKVALWDTDTSVTAENGPIDRSNLEYYDSP